jgi:hypothetical protein
LNGFECVASLAQRLDVVRVVAVENSSCQYVIEIKHASVSDVDQIISAVIATSVLVF